MDRRMGTVRVVSADTTPATAGIPCVRPRRQGRAAMRPLNATDPQYIADYRLLRRLDPGETFLAQAPDASIVVVRIGPAAEAAIRVRGRYVAQVRGLDAHGSPPWLAAAYHPGPSL